MKNILKDSFKLITISFVSNFCLFIPLFLCDGLGLYTFYSENMNIVFYSICIIIEILVFSIVGSKMKFSYESLVIFFIVSVICSFISTELRGGWSSLMMLNIVVISYNSFAKSLIFPIFETVFKTAVLLISSIISKYKTKGGTSCRQSGDGSMIDK